MWGVCVLVPKGISKMLPSVMAHENKGTVLRKLQAVVMVGLYGVSLALNGW
jgi:hypothetical protein